jgi:hypothetical protein
MKLMKLTILSAVAVLAGLCGAPVVAQSLPQQPYTYAASYGSWSLQGQAANTYVFNGRSTCNQQAPAGTFFPFATNAPVYIADQTTSSSEVVTPSAIVQSGATCGVTVSPANQHYSFSLRSGTGGLQEALNALAGSNRNPQLVLLDRNWYTAASSVPGTNPAAIIAAAVTNTTVLVSDITTLPATNYVWNGTNLVAGTWTGAKPTAAAGAGAGSSPTISDVGTAGSGTVSLTSGTSTTTGTLFTLAWATTGSYLFAPTCTVTSVGANAYTTFTVATAFGSSHATTTVTVATTPPVASTAYKFTYSCI